VCLLKVPSVDFVKDRLCDSPLSETERTHEPEAQDMQRWG